MKTKLQTKLNEARKGRDVCGVQAYSAVIAAIQTRENGENVNLTDGVILSMIDKEMMKFHEASTCYAKANNHKMADEMKSCELTLCELLPDKVDESDYDDIVIDAIEKSGAKCMKEMGLVMKHIKLNYGTSVDNKAISKKVCENLR